MSFDLKSALITYLSSKTLLTALLPKLTGSTKFAISPDYILGQGQKRPYIVITIHGETDRTHLGGDIALVDAPVAIQVFSDNGVDRSKISGALRDILSGRTNDVLTDGANSVTFESWRTSWIEKPFLNAPDGTGSGVYTGTALFKFTYNQAVPTLP